MDRQRQENMISNMLKACRCFTYKARYDYVSSFAAHTALFMIMSLFPLMMFFMTLLQHLPFQSADLMLYLTEHLPNCIEPLMKMIVSEVYEEVTNTFQSVAVLVAIFCAAKGFYAIMLGMNAIYGIREDRSIVTRYCIAAIYVVAFVAILIMTLGVLVFGKFFYQLFVKSVPLWAGLQTMLNLICYLGALLLLTIFFTLVYVVVPNRKSRIKYELPGAAFSAIGWVVFSWGFSFYINHLANYSMTYGSLATIVIFMMWFYVAMNILFIGAEINVVLRKYRESHHDFREVLNYYQDSYELQELLKRDQNIMKEQLKMLYNARQKKVLEGKKIEKK